MEHLSPGDRVFAGHGQQCRVTSVSEVKNIECYRLTFGDGESIVCDAEHLWVTKIANQNMRPRSITEMYDAKRAGLPVTVPVAGALDIPDVALPIDPWVLGYWLGNGGADRPVVTTHSEDADHVVAMIQAAGYQIGTIRQDRRAKATAVSIVRVKHLFTDLGLLGHKHVPADYLRASAPQRLALLRGLMDSDGTCANRRNRAVFGSTDSALRDDVAELARSLGEVVITEQHTAAGYGKTVTSFGASWQPSVNPFSTPRKASRFSGRKLRAYRVVRSVDQVTSVRTRCIAVDSPDHTFLAGRLMVPTHNTALRRLCKWLPQTVELATAVDAEDRDLVLGDLAMTAGHSGTELDRAEAIEVETPADPDAKGDTP